MKWRKFVTRKSSVLFLYLLTFEQDEEKVKKIIGQKLGYNSYIYTDGDVFGTEEDFIKVNDKLKKRIKREGFLFLKEFAIKWENLGKDLLKFSKTLDKDFSKVKDDRLVSLFKKYVKKNGELSSAINISINIGIILEQEINNLLKLRLKDDQKVQDYFLVLTSPDRLNENEKESRALLKIGAYLQENNISLEKLDEKGLKMIDKYISDFGWFNVGRSYRRGYNKEEVVERLRELIKENCKEKLDRIIKSEKENNKRTNEIMDELRFNKEERLLIGVAKYFVFLRTFRMNSFMLSAFYTRSLLAEIAKRINLDLESLVFMTPEEIINYLKGRKISLDIIKKRKEGYGMYIEKGKVTVFLINEIEKYKKKYGVEEEIKKVSEIKGSIANKGFVKGIVKIINSKEDIKKLESGEILVAPMTLPDMIPAMQKAAAFVTDEGGIICHAAIVSREMNKPCIIGTKIATKVLHDGDLVEVDADKGVSKVLENGN